MKDIVKAEPKFDPKSVKRENAVVSHVDVERYHCKPEDPEDIRLRVESIRLQYFNVSRGNRAEDMEITQDEFRHLVDGFEGMEELVLDVPIVIYKVRGEIVALIDSQEGKILYLKENNAIPMDEVPMVDVQPWGDHEYRETDDGSACFR